MLGLGLNENQLSVLMELANDEELTLEEMAGQVLGQKLDDLSHPCDDVRVIPIAPVVKGEAHEQRANSV